MKFELKHYFENVKCKIFIVLLNALIFLILSLFITCRFEDNDDVIMLLFSSGSYTGQSETILVFINYLYGALLQNFYIVLPNYEWYTLFFLLFHVISVSVLSYEILKVNTGRITKVIFLFILYLVEIRLLFQLQFTTTSALLALAGFILITKKSNFYLFFGAILFIISSLIRFEAAFLVLLIFSPQIMKKLYFHDFKLKYFVIVCSIVGITFGLKYIDYLHVKQSDAWSNYYDYNLVRGKINDNPNFEKTQFNNEIANKEDLFLLVNFFPDGKVLSISKLQMILKNINKINLNERLTNVYPSLRQYTFILLMFFSLFAVLYLNLNKFDRKFVILHFIIFLGSLIFISFNATLKYRVFLSALMVLFYIVVVYSTDIQLKWNRTVLNLLLIIFFIIFSNRTYKLWLQKSNWTKNEFSRQVNLVSNFYLNHQNKQLVVFPADFSVEFFNALNTSYYFRNKKVLYAGWLTNIPYNKTLTSHFDLINNSILISKINFDEKLPTLVRSIERNYKVKIHVQIDSKINDYLIVRLENRKY